jgi:hypothetical protein
LRNLAFSALADSARTQEDWLSAARLRFRVLSSTGDASLFLLLVTEADHVPNFSCELPPSSVIIPHVTQLLSRTRSNYCATFVEKCLLQLAEDFPLELCYALVPCSNDSFLAELLIKALPTGMWNEAKSLSAGLIQASRSMDEEFADVFDELTKNSWFSKSSSAVSLRKAGEALFEQYLKAEGKTLLDLRFQSSQAGKAIASWCLDACNEGKFEVAKSELKLWFAQLGSRRIVSELSPGLSRTFSCFLTDDHEISVGTDCFVLSTKTRPRRFELGGKAYLLKSGEDLRLDARLNDLWGLVKPEFKAYLVIPLSHKVGLIEWVKQAVPLLQAYREEFPRFASEDITPHSQESKLDAFRRLAGKSTPCLKKLLWKTSPSPELWFAKVEAFTVSCAQTSMLGWLVGLGDRFVLCLPNCYLGPRPD